MLPPIKLSEPGELGVPVLKSDVIVPYTLLAPDGKVADGFVRVKMVLLPLAVTGIYAE